MIAKILLPLYWPTGAIYVVLNLNEVPERIKGTTKGQRVINSAVTCALKSNFLDHRHVLGLFKPGV